MEKKTIGGFLAALRKANGMTQKDLAERLHVSDKTISRWERDEGTPDLASIPAIAEIFGVTCDELLRGERTSPSDRSTAESDATPKAEKQRQRLLKSTLSQYRSRTYIAMGVSTVGFIIALLCNLASLKAVLGFFLGAIFFAASMVCQAIFVNKAFLSVEDAGLDPALLSGYKRSVIRLAEKSIGLTVAFGGFTAPLILVDAYLGLGADSLLLWGSIGAATFLLLYAVILYAVNASLLKRGVFTLSEKEAELYHHNHRLKRICALVLFAVLAVTFLAHQTATTIWGPYTIMEGSTFTDYESFIAYMEQDIPAMPRQESSHIAPDSVPVAEEQIGPTTYYDQYGNEISEEEAMTRRLEDRNGNVVCEYVARNKSVVSLQYSPQNGTVLPITVFTDQDLRDARQTARIRHVVFSAVYCAELLAAVLIYFRKRAKSG